MTKPKTQSLSKKDKKKPTKEDIQKLIASQHSQDIQKPKKRLRKIQKNDSSQEDFVPEGSDEDQLFDEKYAINDPQSEQYSRFKIQNDDDIKQENQKQQQKKKTKKMKGNQQIDKFISKHGDKQKQAQKPKKKQQVVVQTNIQDFFKRQKQKKQRQAQRQKTPVMSDNSQIQNNDSISEGELLLKQMQARQKIYQLQGTLTNKSQRQLIQQAKKLSLESAKKQKTKVDDDYVDINDFQFDNLDPHEKKVDQKPKDIKNQRKKSFQKMEIEKPLPKYQQKKYQQKKAQPKPPVKKSAKKQKQPNEGQLGAEVIAFTGQFEPYSKDQLIELVQKLGATNPKSITKGTTALFQGLYVVNEWKKKTGQDVTTTGKSVQAKQKGIRIVPNNELDDYFLEKTGKTLQQHFRVDKRKLDGFVQKDVQRQTDKMDIQIANPDYVKKHKSDATFGVLWTEKYKPQTLDDVIGQNKQIKQLREWLQDWEDVVLKGNKKDAIPSKGFLASGTINSRAALLSGDPGLGKTTTARLLAKQLNYNVIEFNASDIRNKKGVQLLETNSLGLHQSSSLVKNLVIMDQVDGMSKGDRGGITQIIHMIKNTTVPIICICNDRQSEKIRSLAGHCFDIKFHKPNKQMIAKRLKDIVQLEGGKASDLFLTRLVQTFQNDMRQILNYLELAFNTKASQLFQIKDADHLHGFSKDNAVMLTNYGATSKLLTKYKDQIGGGMPLRERMECFFIDSDFVPLMIHENYIGSMKKGKLTKKQFHKLVKANDAFVLADLIDTRIRKEQDWGLMPAFGFMSSVYPAEMVAESIGFPQFPQWLGKFSSERKHKRLLKQLKQTIHCELPSTLKGVRYGLAENFYQQINYLLKHEKVQETLDLMENYGLSPAFMNQVLLEIQYNPQKNLLLPDVTTSTKTKLTKAFNRRHEEAKMKGKAKKVTVVAPQHHKYNQVLDQMSDDDFIVNDDQEENNENSNIQNDDITDKNKNKKKAAKGVNKRK